MDHITDQDILDIAALNKHDLIDFLTRLRHQINELNQLVTTTAAAKRWDDQIASLNSYRRAIKQAATARSVVELEY